MKTSKYRQILFSTATSGLLLLVSFVLAAGSITGRSR